MNQPAFYAAVGTHNPLRFYLEAVDTLCVGLAERGFVMGGVGLAAAVDAIERATGRPLIWATAQYLSFAQPGEFIDIDVRAPIVGNHTTQARAVSHVGEREILTVNAALGARADQPFGQFAEMPKVPPPADCEVEIANYHMDPTRKDLNSMFEKRHIPTPGSAEHGRTRRWIRTQEDMPVTAGLLAIVGDYLLGGIYSAMNRDFHTSSLDNTLRIHCLKDSRWLLCDSWISGVASGFCHGEMNIFSEDGTLLAIASQSGIARPI